MEASLRCEKVASCYRLWSQLDICTFKVYTSRKIHKQCSFSGYLLFTNMVHMTMYCSLHIWLYHFSNNDSLAPPFSFLAACLVFLNHLDTFSLSKPVWSANSLSVVWFGQLWTVNDLSRTDFWCLFNLVNFLNTGIVPPTFKQFMMDNSSCISIKLLRWIHNAMYQEVR